jgi:hypothetical protein
VREGGAATVSGGLTRPIPDIACRVSDRRAHFLALCAVRVAGQRFANASFVARRPVVRTRRTNWPLCSTESSVLGLGGGVCATGVRRLPPKIHAKYDRNNGASVAPRTCAELGKHPVHTAGDDRAAARAGTSTVSAGQGRASCGAAANAMMNNQFLVQEPLYGSGRGQERLHRVSSKTVESSRAPALGEPGSRPAALMPLRSCMAGRIGRRRGGRKGCVKSRVGTPSPVRCIVGPKALRWATSSKRMTRNRTQKVLQSIVVKRKSLPRVHGIRNGGNKSATPDFICGVYWPELAMPRRRWRKTTGGRL